jgi:phosphoribosylaminoimidazole-succinocarboxamide synthase
LLKPKLFYPGSSKNIWDLGEYFAFEFLDQYSIFDWGKMPDLIPDKGKYSCRLTSVVYQYLESHGVLTHRLAAKSDEGVTMSLGEAWLPVKKVEVLRPIWVTSESRYDYSAYQHRPARALIPMEWVFRFGVTAGSSYLKRYPHTPVGQVWSQPILECFTKLEAGDRYLSDREACEISHMGFYDFQKWQKQITEVAMLLQKLFQHAGFTLWDGKLEWAWYDADQMLVDAVTLDELRIEDQISGEIWGKECLREFYRGTDWYQRWQELKHVCLGQEAWQQAESLGLRPPSAPADLIRQVSRQYRGAYERVAAAVQEVS